MEPRKTSTRAGSTRSKSRGVESADDVAASAESSDRSTTEFATQPRGIAGKVRERATAQLSTQKDRASDGLGTIAQAVRQTTDRLRSEQHETLAGYVEQAAEQIERLSNGLREKPVGELLQDAQQFARRQPALFIGGSFAVGLLAARFLKSSGEGERHDYQTRHIDPTTGAY
jgi:ElaB/YqjD/DUF883 family membrane-anchored ribosome-binding protein